VLLELLRAASSATTKHLAGSFDKLTLPLADLIRMHPVFLGDLPNRFVFPQRLQGNPGFLFGTSMFSSHWLLPSPSTLPNHLRECPEFWEHYSLGLWAALPEVFPTTKSQRCWVHKTANVLDEMPKSVQGRAKAMIHDIYRADTKQNAEKAYQHFIASFQAKYPKATACLEKDREELFAFYELPAEHWLHIRSTNVIESVFATVRLRTNKTKGCGTRIATLTMVFKLITEAQKTWRKLDACKKLRLVQEGRRFIDGELMEEPAA
jgi:hypothetical protein